MTGVKISYHDVYEERDNFYHFHGYLGHIIFFDYFRFGDTFCNHTFFKALKTLIFIIYLCSSDSAQVKCILTLKINLFLIWEGGLFVLE